MELPKLSDLLRNSPAAARLDRALDGLGVLAAHEAAAIDRHVLAVRERLQVARRARGVGELLRDQIDLLPATTARFADDHATRRRLWRDLGAALHRPGAADDAR